MTLNNKRGSILLMCFCVIASLSIIAAAFGVLMVNESLSLRHNLQNVQASYLAQAGLQEAIGGLKSGNIDGISGSLGAGQYAVEITNVNDGRAKYKIVVKSTGVVGQTRKIIQAYATVPLGATVPVVTGWQVVNS